ncbi:MAG: hypothetical protein HY321_12110 [Armatimonadetes bacterium]|nr:hypothetical protein [Armatimonadota bacterium]
MSPVTASTLGWGACCLLLLASPAVGQETDTSPARLLDEAWQSARAGGGRDADASWSTLTWNSMARLRIANTMRLHGLRDEALAALREIPARNARNTTVESVRDVLTIELCRLLALVGEADEAEGLAETATFRSYAVTARYVIAQALLQTGDAAGAERVLRRAVFLKPDADGKGENDVWRRAAVRLALRMGRLDLAGELISATTTPLWKSGALGDVAVERARAGQGADALKTMGEAPDAYMAVIGLARVAEALARRGPAEPLGDAVKALLQAAAKVENATERDYALVVAVERLAAAGRLDVAAEAAGPIRDPVARVRAQGRLLSAPARGGDRALHLLALREAVAKVPEAERPLAWEIVAVACARKGMAPEALDAGARTANPWQRCRAQGTVSRALAEMGRQTEAVRAAEAAAASAEAVEDPGWRARAHLRVAFDAERAGESALADQQLAAARAAMARVADPDLQPGLVIALVEALGAMKRQSALREFAAEVLKGDPPDTVRARLLPALAAAGESATVVAECDRAKPTAPGRGWLASDRVVVYRLAQRGEGAAAARYARAMGSQRAEALTDVALAQLARPEPPQAPERGVGVCGVAGTAWYPRLERMGLPWEFMPILEPHEVGAAGLAARYVAVAFPGGGRWEPYIGVAGSENIRDYLYDGGGYFGICAGEHLAIGQGYVECDWVSMGCSASPHQVQMRQPHVVSLGLPPVITIRRQNGAILIPRPGCEVLGWYDNIERHAALVAQEYGYGRTVAYSPHPEGGSGFDPRDHLCVNALDWVTRRLP